MAGRDLSKNKRMSKPSLSASGQSRPWDKDPGYKALELLASLSCWTPHKTQLPLSYLLASVFASNIQDQITHAGKPDMKLPSTISRAFRPLACSRSAVSVTFLSKEFLRGK